jgi:NADH-quinone oxidoreductase subunit M
MLQATLWGPITKEENRTLRDLDAREVASLLPLCILMLWIGVAPRSFLEPSRPALEGVLAAYKSRLADAPPSRATLAAAASSPVRTFVARQTSQEPKP